jgi:glycosyltransferase involved in cell wall biosynthesis
MKVCLLSDHHICINPRLWKEAFLYEKLGHEVVILTMWQSSVFLEKDNKILIGHDIKYVTYLNMISGVNSIFLNLFYRIRKRFSAEIQRFFKLGISWAISYAPEKMFNFAISESADLYIAHLECAFCVGRKLVKSGKKVAFDFEDWYSRDYLVPERPVKLLNSLEKFAVLNGLFITAASRSMADEIKKKYSSIRTIETIYNGFPIAENLNKINSVNNSDEKCVFKIIWFSRTIGPDRGIEYLVAALKHCSVTCELHLLGMTVEGYSTVINSIFPFKFGHRLYIHSFIEHNSILPFLGQFNLGLAIEESINDNKNLTISNKILQYIQATLPVLCSNTIGHLEVASYFPNTIFAVNIKDEFEVAKKIDFLSKNRKSYSKEDMLRFKAIFSWEAQEKKLVNLINKSQSDEKIPH